MCIPCEDITGYYTTQNSLTKANECTEICGDGLNLGEYQCDDGNLKDGDGCSSKCTYEEGFECHGGNTTHPDTCKDIVSPITVAGIMDTKKLTFTFIFSKPVQILSSQEPKTFVVLSITGDYIIYDFDYEILFYKEEIVIDNPIDSTSLSNNATHNKSRLLQVDEETIDFYKSTVISLIPRSSLEENDVH